jgi:hypothetical protein
VRPRQQLGHQELEQVTVDHFNICSPTGIIYLEVDLTSPASDLVLTHLMVIQVLLSHLQQQE